MATITSLGFSIFTRYDSSGMRRARNDFQRMRGDFRASQADLNRTAQGFHGLRSAMIALAPAAAPVAGAITAVAGATLAMGATAGSALGAYGLAMHNAVKRTLEMAEAGKALTPMQQKFVTSYRAMGKAVDELGSRHMNQLLSVATDVTSGVAAGIRKLHPVINAVHPIIKRVSAAFREWASGSGMDRFVAVIREHGVPALNALMNAGRHTLTFLGHGFRAFAPLGTQVAQVIERGAAALAKWAAGGGFERWLAAIRPHMPAVGEFFKALGAALLNVGKAFAGLGPLALGVTTTLLRLVAALPPSWIQAIVLGFTAWKVAMAGLMIIQTIIVIVNAFKMAWAALNLVFVASPIGLIIAGIVALIAAIVLIATKTNWFQNVWNVAWTIIKNVWNATWNAIKVVAEVIWNGLQMAWQIFVTSFSIVWQASSAVLTAVWNAVWNAIRTVATGIWNFLKTAWENFILGLRVAWIITSAVLSAAWNATWNALRTVATAIWNALGAAWRAFITGLSAIWTVTSSVLSTAWSATWNAIRAVATAVWNAMTAAWRAFTTGLTAVWNAARTAITATWNVFWNGLRTAATAVWNAMRAGWQAFWNAMQTIASAVFNALRSAASSFWTAFRGIFTAGWNALRAGWQAIWNAISAAFTAIANAMNGTARVFWNAFRSIFTAGHNALRTAWSATWNAVSAAFTAICNAINGTARVFWNAIRSIYRTMHEALRTAWRNIWNDVSNIFTSICNAINGTARVFWNAIRNIYRTMHEALRLAWRNIWNDVRVIFTNICNVINEIARTFWNALRTLFRTAHEALRLAWRNIWNDVRNIAQNFIDWVKEAFEACWNSIRSTASRIWNNIGNTIEGAINGVIGIINKLINGFNNIADAVNIDVNISTIPNVSFATGGLVPEFARGGTVNLRKGGAVRGYAPGKDRVPAMLSPGEGVLTPEAVRGLGGPGFIHSANKTFAGHRGAGKGAKPMHRFHRQGDAHGHFAKGGLVPVQHFAVGGITSAALARAGVPLSMVMQGEYNPGGVAASAGTHDRGGAVDIGSTSPAILMALRAAGFAAWIRGPAQGMTPHIHAVLMNHPDLSPGAAAQVRDFLAGGDGLGAGGGGGGGIGALLDAFGDMGGILRDIAMGKGNPLAEMISSFLGLFGRTAFETAFDWIEDLISGWDNPAGKVGQIVIGFAKTALKGVIDFLTEKDSEATPDFSGGFAGGGGNVQMWAPLAAKALAMAGLSASQLPRFLALMQAESGGNPMAINLWDSNAAAGQASRGLMQVIPSTFAAYRDPSLPNNIFDPLANMVAAARYIRARYGGNVPGSPYALGTPGATKGWHLVGERGPEMVKFRGGEQVRSNRDTEAWFEAKGGNGSVTVTVPITVQGNMDQDAVARLERELIPKLRMLIQQKVGR